MCSEESNTMCNSYLNGILYGHSHRNISPEYIAKHIAPHIFNATWLETYMNNSVETIQEQEPLPIVEPAPLQRTQEHTQEPQPQQKQEKPPRQTKEKEPPNKLEYFRPKQQNTLFWSIYTNEYPTESFLRLQSDKNTEIETRVRVVDTLKTHKNRLKDTNSKLTMEATQSLFGAMLVAQEDRPEFCIAYSAFFNKNIFIVYPNTYKVFSPTVEVDVEDDDHSIIIYAERKQGCRSTNQSRVSYGVDLSPTKQKVMDILENKLTVLKTQPNYKTAELEEMAGKFGIETKTEDGKRLKKQELYDNIRVFIHNDMLLA